MARAAPRQGNRAPVLTPLADYPIRAGTVERLEVQAIDPDRDSLSFRLVRGPSFVSIRTLNSAGGLAEIRVAPDSCERGDHECTIEVSDGSATDTKTMHFKVHPIARATPASPMQAPAYRENEPFKNRSPVDSVWIAGEWELYETITSERITSDELIGVPLTQGHRRRLVFARHGRVLMFDIATGLKLSQARTGTYTIHGNLLTISNWIGEEFQYLARNHGSITFRTTKCANDMFGIYPEGVSDADFDVFIRTPPVCREGVPVDTARILLPVEAPSIRMERGQAYAVLPKPMRDALRTYDPAFRPWTQSDSKALGEGAARGPSTVVGDFDGDLLKDIAILGRSGADQVLVALLSDFGRIRAVEIAWRRVVAGEGKYRSRGDPHDVRSVYLELVPRGSTNPFCWGVHQPPNPLDAVGVVQPGVARFDYMLARDRFILYAPSDEVPGYRISKLGIPAR